MVPVRLSLADRWVELVDMPGERFTAPFLEHTDHEHRRREPPSPRGRAPLDEYLARGDPEGDDPVGFVFGTGRSGSTLLANMLGELGDLVVMKEAQPIGEVVNALVWRKAADDPSSPPIAELRETLRRVVRSLFRPTAGQHRLAVKASWLGSAHADELLAGFPDAPAVFVTRAAVPVVESFLALPPPWVGDLIHHDTDWLAALLPSLAGQPCEYLDPAALYAHFWLSATAAIGRVDPDRVLTVDHDRLQADPMAVLASVLDHFELSASDRDLDAARDRARYYSKPEPGEAPRLAAEVDRPTVTLPATTRARIEALVAEGGGG